MKRSMNRQSHLALAAISSLILAGFACGQSAAPSKPPSNDTPQSAQSRISGCPEWLQGKWIFDEEHTQQKYSEAKPREGLDAVRHGLVYPQLVEQLKGAHVTVTDKEVVMTTKDGNGKAFPYQVLELSDDSVTLKQNDGEVTTYHKEGQRFWTASTGNVNIPFYFKRTR